MIDELRTLMGFRPVSHDRSATTAVLRYAADKLEQAGLHVEWLEHGGVKSVYASTRGTHHAKVLLQAHVDVVPGGKAFARQGDTIYGRGCYDMLFAVASYLQLLTSLDTIQKYDLAILLTSDEEVGGTNGVGWLVEEMGYRADVCILPDAGEALGTMSIGAKGMWQATLLAHGRSHHASRPWDGDNAARKLVRFLDELGDVFDRDNKEASTLTIAQLSAGSEARNQGPAEARAGIDIRFSDEADYQRIRQAMTELAKQYDVQVTDEQLGRAYTIDMLHPLVQSFISLYHTTTGVPITTHRSYGSSDARFFDAKGIPVIMIRPAGGGAHGDDEWLSLAEWQQFQGLLQQYVIQTAGENGSSL